MLNVTYYIKNNFLCFVQIQAQFITMHRPLLDGYHFYINERQWRTTAQVAVLSQRGRAMLPVCLVSFNSTIPRAQSFSISYCGIRMIRLSLLVINTSSTVPANNKRCRLATCHGPAQLTAVCITLGTRTAEDMWWSQISVENRILPNPPWYVFDSPIRGGAAGKLP